MDWTWYLFRFDGRINRAKFWLARLVILLLAGLLADGPVILADRQILSARRHLQFRHLDDLFKLVDPDVVPRADAGRSRPAPPQVARHARCSCGSTSRPRSSGCTTATRAAGGWCRSSSSPASTASSPTGCPIPTAILPLRLIVRQSCSVGLHRDVLPEGLAQDQPVRRRPAGAAATARHAAALGPAERDRNGAAQGWPAAGLAC